MYVHAAARVAAHDYARLKVDQVERIASARADDGQTFQRLLIDRTADVT